MGVGGSSPPRPTEQPRTRQRTGVFHKETTVKKLILIALAAAAAVLVAARDLFPDPDLSQVRRLTAQR